MMRLMQAVGLILTSYAGLLALAQPSHLAGQHLATHHTLLALQDWLNVTRRSLRTFWFLRAFEGSYAQYQAAAGGLGVEDLLDVVAGSLLGLFGLLETATLPDLTRVPGLAVFGPEHTRRLNMQAQALWFLALLAGVLSAAVRVVRLLAERAVPRPADFGVEGDRREKSGGGSKEGLARKREAERRRRVDKKEAARKRRAQISALTLKIVNDTLDMVIPANICGWSNFHPGQVGIAMAITSLITLRGHWQRCARALE